MGHPCTIPRQKMHLPLFQSSKTSVKNFFIFYRTLEMLNDGFYTFIKCGNLLNIHFFFFLPCQSFQSSISSASRASVGWKSNNSIARKYIKHNQNSHYTNAHFSTHVPEKLLRIDIKQGGSVPGESNPNSWLRICATYWFMLTPSPQLATGIFSSTLIWISCLISSWSINFASLKYGGISLNSTLSLIASKAEF